MACCVCCSRCLATSLLGLQPSPGLLYAFSCCATPEFWQLYSLSNGHAVGLKSSVIVQFNPHQVGKCSPLLRSPFPLPAPQSSTQYKLQPFCCLCIKICCDNSVDNLLHIYLSRFLAAPQPAPLHPCTPGPLHPVPCGTAFALCCVHSRLNIRCV